MDHDFFTPKKLTMNASLQHSAARSVATDFLDPVIIPCQ